MALAALDSGIMTPFALENVELYNKYGSVGGGGRRERVPYVGEAVCRLLHLPWRHRLDAGLIIAIFHACAAKIPPSPNRRRRPAFSRSTNRILFGLPVIMNPVMFIPFIPCSRCRPLSPAGLLPGLIPPITNIAP